eukprot:1131600-Amphidinium_carterae.1
MAVKDQGDINRTRVLVLEPLMQQFAQETTRIFAQIISHNYQCLSQRVQGQQGGAINQLVATIQQQQQQQTILDALQNTHGTDIMQRWTLSDLEHV